MKTISLYLSILLLTFTSVAYVSAYTTEDGYTNDMNTVRIKKEMRAGNAERMTQGVQLMKFKSENSMSEKKSMMHSGSGKTESGMTLEQLTCVRAAVAKRESSLLSALTTSSSTLATAYSTRALALDAAYQLTDKVARRTAIESAWEAWMTSLKDARKAHQVSQKAAWDTFKSDTKTCGVSSKQTDAGGAQSDMVQ